MFEDWLMTRPGRCISAGGTFIGGYFLTSWLLRLSNVTTIISLFSFGLAALVGAVKLTSP